MGHMQKHKSTQKILLCKEPILVDNKTFALATCGHLWLKKTRLHPKQCYFKHIQVTHKICINIVIEQLNLDK